MESVGVSMTTGYLAPSR